jgi:hypothetical protein
LGGFDAFRITIIALFGRFLRRFGAIIVALSEDF